MPRAGFPPSGAQGQPGEDGTADAFARIAADGIPQPNVPVTFTEANGQGLFLPQPILTDANGEASTQYALPTTFSTHPLILVNAATGASTSFSARWRGMFAQILPGNPLPALNIGILHSESNSPFTIAAEPSTGIIYLNTPAGPVLTSVLNPTASLGVLDGMGLVLPPDPQFRTPLGTPAWSTFFEGLPVFGNLSLTLQAYAVDSQLIPSPAAVMISNAVTIVLP